MGDKKLVEVDPVSSSPLENDDPTKRRVEVTVRWTSEDTRWFDVPAEMSLNEVACSLEFNTANWTPEETQWGAIVIEDVDSEEQWEFE